MNEIGLPQPWLRRGLSVIGTVAVVFEVVRQFRNGDIAGWVLVVMLVATLAWLVLVFLPEPWRLVPYLCLAVMVAGGGVAAGATNGLGIVTVGVALVWVTRSTRIPLAVTAALGLAGVVAIAVGALVAGTSLLGLLALEAGLALAFLVGQTRRQYVRSEEQSRALFETAVAVREEQARADVLAARQNIAHDIHDVLAHSLGGLVIQLDAVDALLESGDVAGAAARVRESRALAAEGLGEARRAVDALREPPENSGATVTGDTLVGSLTPFLRSHRSLGGEVDFVEGGARADLGEPLEVALRRALQEGLTNARKHAPGAAVSVRLDWGADSVALRIQNRLVPTATATATVRATPSADAPSGGHGLTGMRERFAALPGGSATARIESDRFVVTVEGALG